SVPVAISFISSGVKVGSFFIAGLLFFCLCCKARELRERTKGGGQRLGSLGHPSRKLQGGLRSGGSHRGGAGSHERAHRQFHGELHRYLFRRLCRGLHKQPPEMKDAKGEADLTGWRYF